MFLKQTQFWFGDHMPGVKTVSIEEVALAGEYEIAVVGGGLAGLTAALFAARCGRSTLTLISGMVGGHLTNVDNIEDFPGFPAGIAGYELCPKLQEQAANAGAEFRMAEAQRLEACDGGWLLATTGGDFHAGAIILACGSHPRTLGVPGEDRLQGHGISHCAGCDGPLLRGGPAVVVGGGDSAFLEALTLANFSSEVTIVHRSELSRAQQTYRRRVEDHPKIHLRPNSTVQEIVGQDTVSAVRLRDAAGEAAERAAAGVWVYVGLDPNTAWLDDTLRLDEAGRIRTDVWLRTELPGVFAAGDVRSDSASQAITAAGDGATAAIAAHRHLQ